MGDECLTIGQALLLPEDPGSSNDPDSEKPPSTLFALKRSILDYARSSNLMQDLDIRRHLKDIEKEIRHRVCLDQRDFYDHLVQQLGAQGDLHNYKFVFNLLTRLGGRPGNRNSGGKSLPFLRPADGVRATDALASSICCG